MNSSPTAVGAHRLEQGDDLRRGGAVGAGQAGAIDGPHAGVVGAGKALDTWAPAAVLPAPPKRAPSSLISISAKKLCE